MHDRAQIRQLHQDGQSVTQIARTLGIARSTVYRALDPDTPDHYVRGHQVSDFHDQIHQVLTRWPHMPAVGIAYRLRWPGSMSTFTQRVNEIRRQILYPDPTTTRLVVVGSG